ARFHNSPCFLSRSCSHCKGPKAHSKHPGAGSPAKPFARNADGRRQGRDEADEQREIPVTKNSTHRGRNQTVPSMQHEDGEHGKKDIKSPLMFLAKLVDWRVVDSFNSHREPSVTGDWMTHEMNVSARRLFPFVPAEKEQQKQRKRAFRAHASELGGP